jgi:hypothetical protein
MNVGLVKTEIMRATPWWMKLGFAVLGPLITVPVETSAKNAVWLTTHADWASGIYLPKPGDPSQQTKLALDAAQTEKAMQASRDLVGV